MYVGMRLIYININSRKQIQQPNTQRKATPSQRFRWFADHFAEDDVEGVRLCAAAHG